MMLLSHKQLSMLRFGLVLLATSVVTLCYYSFSHFVHHPRHFNHGQHNGTHRSPFTDIYLKEYRLFFYHLARPLALVTLVSVWNLSTSNTEMIVLLQVLTLSSPPFGSSLLWTLNPFG